MVACCLLLAACPSSSKQGDDNADSGNSQPNQQPSVAATYSRFAPYQALPNWSTWCGLADDPQACAAPLRDALTKQSPSSRPTVRNHGWFLWAAIWSALELDGYRNDVVAQRTNSFGTTGCWTSFADGSPACSGAYPIWITWPNSGRPTAGLSAGKDGKLLAADAAGSTNSRRNTLREISRAFSPKPASADPDPTKVSTINPAGPSYALPPLVLSKQCGMTSAKAEQLLASKNYKAIEQACEAAGAQHMFCPPSDDSGQPQICDGVAFINQGDLMIATESLSEQGYTDIQQAKLYGGSDTLASMYLHKDNSVASKIGNDYISTKHMFWPVKGCKPGASLGEEGCRVRYGALPPWVPGQFKAAGVQLATNADYLGYEKWQRVVAIDTCVGAEGTCPAADQAALELAHVEGDGVGPITTRDPEIYQIGDFIHVQISKEVLEQRFSAADRALLDQAMIWGYGDESNGFEPGDFLIVAAMHVTTKELDSWAFQSVWWSPMTDKPEDCPLDDYASCFGQTAGYAATAAPNASAPNPYSGLSADDIAKIDAQVGSAWRNHYLLIDDYGINYQIDGTPVTASNYFQGSPPPWATTGPTGEPLPLLPVAMNVYIEPVIHPLGTSCQNCHRRAGYPAQSCGEGYSGGCGRANGQTAQCAALLGDYGNPGSDPCMTTPWAWHDGSGDHCDLEDPNTKCSGDAAYPVVDTNYIWLIADGHIPPRTL